MYCFFFHVKTTKGEEGKRKEAKRRKGNQEKKGECRKEEKRDTLQPEHIRFLAKGWKNTDSLKPQLTHVLIIMSLYSSKKRKQKKKQREEHMLELIYCFFEL